MRKRQEGETRAEDSTGRGGSGPKVSCLNRALSHCRKKPWEPRDRDPTRPAPESPSPGSTSWAALTPLSAVCPQQEPVALGSVPNLTLSGLSRPLSSSSEGGTDKDSASCLPNRHWVDTAFVLENSS